MPLGLGEGDFSAEEAEAQRAPPTRPIHAMRHSVQMLQEDVGLPRDRVEANKLM